VVIHYHWRPGGVRRVIELTLPAIFQSAQPYLEKITLISGTSACEKIPECPVEYVSEPAFDYFAIQSDDTDTIARRIRLVLTKSIPQEEAHKTLIWFHNPALARNIILNREVMDFAETSGASLIMHHHDFWCAGRWARWPEMKQCGVDGLDRAASATLANQSRSTHVAINLPDFQTLDGALNGRIFHLPNPVVRDRLSKEKRLKDVRRWLSDQLQSDDPIWVFPTRFLRRKNLLEAVLLTRWLSPNAVFVTSSSDASPDEKSYASVLEEAAQKGRWKVCFGLLDKPGAPSVAELLQVAEVALLTSIQEGFGMGFIEAAAAGTPLIARALPDVMPDLAAMGFHFPYLYEDVFIDPSLIDIPDEIERQRLARVNVEARLPAVLKAQFSPKDLDFTKPVPFSRLSQRGQLHILNHPAEEAWSLCRTLNPSLANIEKSLGRLVPTKWPSRPPQTALRFAREFLKIARSAANQPETDSVNVVKAQAALIKHAFESERFYPLQAES
jgi:glycosyltransferase involved in cell wall biosynthesis